MELGGGSVGRRLRYRPGSALRTKRCALLHAGARIGPFLLLSELGRGGWGVVFAAQHLRLETMHAVKVVDATLPGRRARALREARIQTTLRHPNIVAATDLVITDEHVCIVADLVDGPSLHARLQAGPLTVGQASSIARALVAAVAYLHLRQIVHRDIKPANVLLERSLAPPVCRLIDFGVAKDLSEAEVTLFTDPQSVVGTPQYMAPEQLGAACVPSPSADVFALGCLLYELFTGHRPFPAAPVRESQKLRALEQFAAPALLAEGLPPQVVAGLEGALRGDPRRRIPTAWTLAEVLDGRVDGRAWTAGLRCLRVRPSRTEAVGPPPLTTQPLSPGRVARSTPPE